MLLRRLVSNTLTHSSHNKHDLTHALPLAEDGDEEPSPSDEETPETPEESEAAEEDAEGAARPLALSFAGIAGVLGSAVVGAAIAL